jgi:glycosyltransferase involved in cell wall biosynthesis
MPRRILAVGHDAYRAGSQILFLHLLRWLREHHDSDLSLVLMEGGDLLDEYTSVLPTRVLPVKPGPRGPSRLASAPREVRYRMQMRREMPHPGSVDLVYANSVASAGLAATLAVQAGCPAVCHVHELEFAMRRAIGSGKFREADRHIAGYIAVSEAVERNLVENHGIAAERIDRVHGGIPLSQPGGGPDGRAELKRELGIPSDAVVVGGCGTVDWRKAPEIFVLVAKALADKSPAVRVHFLWVGGDPKPLDMLRHDVERLGITDTVTFVGQRADPTAYFALFDVFLLTSREDPFPLVCLEAAALGKPIVCFADAGGTPELVEDDAGYVVGYLDVEGAAQRLLSLVGSECTRAALGQRAAAKVVERYSIEVVGPQVASALDRYLR